MARGKSSAKRTWVHAQPPIKQPPAGDPGGSTNGSAIEQQVVAFAEQLGRIVGTVQARAEGWLDPGAPNDQMTRVRGGAVDAPGKKHRKLRPNGPLRAGAADKARIAKMKAVNASRRGRG